jgi:predicted esterase
MHFDHVFHAGTSGWTLLLLHGTGGDEHELVPLGQRLAPAAALLSPRGNMLADGGGRRLYEHTAAGAVDAADLRTRTDDIAAFVAAAVAEHRLDAARIAAFGHSAGANVALCLLLGQPALLRGACLLRPTHVGAAAGDPRPDLAGRHVLVAAGERDPLSSAEQTTRLVQLLRDGGATVSLHSDPRAGHPITQGDLLRSVRWWRELTTGPPPP